MSPWHDIPLKAEGGLLNAIIEIPKESSPKLEVATVRVSLHQVHQIPGVAAKFVARDMVCMAIYHILQQMIWSLRRLGTRGRTLTFAPETLGRSEKWDRSEQLNNTPEMLLMFLSAC